MSIENRVKKIVSEQLGKAMDEIQYDSSFVDDLGADSLDTVELVMALEEEFDIEIADEDAENISTVDEAVEYITEYSRFHDDLYVYELETGELMLDSATVNETMRSLETKEQLLIEAAQHPKTFSDVEIFNLLVD